MFNYKIINADVRFPGSSHDSHIWNNSPLLPILRNLHNIGEKNFLIGM